MASQELAAFAAETEIAAADFPYLKILMMDALSCAIAGSKGPYAEELRQTYTSFGTSAQASVLLGQGKCSARDAAAINAFFARNYTFDDIFEPGTIHSGAAIIMSCLAMGEWLDSTVEELAAAIVVGYEVAARSSQSINPQHYDKGFHPTSTCNTLGVAAAASRLLALDSKAATGALRLAADAACGLRQYQLDGDIANSAYHATKAVENGITSALLAKAGFANPGESITGQFGLFRLEAGAWDEDILLKDLGREYRFLQTSLKLYPSCRFMHGAVDAVAICVDENNISAADIRKINITTFKLAAEEGNRPRPQTVLDAQFSMHYNIATYLLKHGLGIEDFTAEAIKNPQAAIFAQLIEVKESEEMSLQYPALWPYRADIQMKDGRSFSCLVTQPLGSPANPVSAEFLQRKCHLLVKPIIGEQKTRDFLKRAADFTAFSSVRSFCAYINSLSGKAAD